MESVVKQLLFCAPTLGDVSRKDLCGEFSSIGDGCHDDLNISHLAVQPHELLRLKSRLLVPPQMPLMRSEIFVVAGVNEIGDGEVNDGWNVSLTTLMNERMSIGA